MFHLARPAAIAGAIAIPILSAGAAGAVSIGFEGPDVDPYVEAGFTFDPSARLVDGNCLSGACLALNDNDVVEMSAGGAAFTLSSINFMLLGQGAPNAFTVSGDNGASQTFSVDDFGANSGYNFIDFGALFASVTAITFDTLGGGNVRIDDLTAVFDDGDNSTIVPLPATALLLVGALATLGWAGRRRAA